MRYLEPFKFIFRQPHWPATLAVGSLLIFIPIAGQIALAGWVVLVHRALVAGDKEIPALKLGDFTKLLQIGAAPFVVQLILGFAISFLVVPITMVPGIAMGIAMPIVAHAPSEEAATTVMIGVIVVSGLIALLSIFVSYLSVMVNNAAMIRVELAPEMSQAMSALSPSFLWSFMKTVRKELFWSSVAMVALGGTFVMLGMVLCYVGLFPAAVVATVAGAHYRHQVYSAYLGKGGSPLPVGPLPGEAQWNQGVPGQAVPYAGPPPSVNGPTGAP